MLAQKSSEHEVGQKIWENKETKDLRWKLMAQKGRREGGKVSIHLENPSWARTGESFRISERNGETSAWKAKQTEFTTKMSASQHFPA